MNISLKSGLVIPLLCILSSCAFTHPQSPDDLDALFLEVIKFELLPRASEMYFPVFVIIEDQDPSSELVRQIAEQGINVRYGSEHQKGDIGVRFVISELDRLNATEVELTADAICDGMCSTRSTYTWQLSEGVWRINSSIKIMMQ